MDKIAVVTDSNSGITQKEAESLGVYVLPMPFYIDKELFYEDINLTQEEFYEKLKEGADISTSAPSPGEVTQLWDKVLEKYDSLVYLPMSSGLSSSCDAAKMLASQYEGKVYVVDNQRISVTLKQSIFDAKEMVKEGYEAAEIKKVLEEEKLNSSIYIALDTLKYLKKGGRVTPAAAAIGEVLGLKPVLQIQGGKLDAFAKCRGKVQAKNRMIKAIQADLDNRFAKEYAEGKMVLEAAYTGNLTEALEWKAEIEKNFPGFDVQMDPLSLSVSCHIGAGALAIACTKKYK
jgi:DegV family protein with EDD domain